MSKIVKQTLFIIFIFSFYLSFSQEQNEPKSVIIYINLKDKALESYTIDKDTTGASFSVYLKGYESKKKRENALKRYNNLIGDPSSESFPVFSIAFYVFSRKPERIKSLAGVEYITLKEFRDSNYPETSPTYIIHKLKDGTFLKWEAHTML